MLISERDRIERLPAGLIPVAPGTCFPARLGPPPALSPVPLLPDSVARAPGLAVFPVFTPSFTSPFAPVVLRLTLSVFLSLPTLRSIFGLSLSAFFSLVGLWLTGMLPLLPVLLRVLDLLTTPGLLLLVPPGLLTEPALLSVAGLLSALLTTGFFSTLVFLSLAGLALPPVPPDFLTLLTTVLFPAVEPPLHFLALSPWLSAAPPFSVATFGDTLLSPPAFSLQLLSPALSLVGVLRPVVPEGCCFKPDLFPLVVV